MKRGVVAVLAGAAIAGAVVWKLSRPAPAAPPPPRAGGVRKLGENHWAVPRADRDAYLADPARVNGQLQLKPEPGGKPDEILGLVVFRADPAGPAYRAGFREGDRILSVNDTPVSTLSRAVNLVHEVRAATTLEVEVGRGDSRLRYRFDFE